ncbi:MULTISPECIES: hypothetical protein [unclassified Pseudomonas]|uniref:hypothetical protein n=1 Tax=unclassified Pseudomonas TaxID=196821 RepID=UPI000A1FE4EA|nr:MULTISPECIES: hypothetical protein [unclassified Pseudomonas]
MGKTVEIVHYKVEKFTLTQSELVAALKEKYGDDSAFEEGRLISVFCSTMFPAGPEGRDTEISFETRLGEAAGAAPA